MISEEWPRVTIGVKGWLIAIGLAVLLWALLLGLVLAIYFALA
jgi:hypothetical protein